MTGLIALISWLASGQLFESPTHILVRVHSPTDDTFHDDLHHKRQDTQTPKDKENTCFCNFMQYFFFPKRDFCQFNYCISVSFRGWSYGGECCVDAFKAEALAQQGNKGSRKCFTWPSSHGSERERERNEGGPSTTYWERQGSWQNMNSTFRNRGLFDKNYLSCTLILLWQGLHMQQLQRGRECECHCASSAFMEREWMTVSVFRNAVFTLVCNSESTQI